MLEFLVKCLIEIVLEPVLAAAGWLVRNGVWLALYPLLLATGWLWLWLRSRGRKSFQGLWHVHGFQGLHRAGEAVSVESLNYFLAVILLLLAVLGVGIMVYFIVIQLLS
ncbi:MAG: hypothetical protein ACRYFX_03850 [Janthinobacterium lividum]